jgi:DNA-binding SARP family transcriptional activator
MLILRLFGSPRLVDGHGHPVSLGRGIVGWRLLLYLAIRGETGAIAERIHAAAWSLVDVDDEAADGDDGAQARAVDTVQKAVRRLRLALAPLLPPGVPSIICRNAVYRLNPAAVWTDAAAFAACLAEARLLPDPAALPLLRAALAYCTAPLAREVPAGWFDPVWLDEERAHYAEEVRRATLWAGAILARAGDYAGAATTFARLRTLYVVDDEAAERELICQALRGEPELLTRSFEEHTAAMARIGMQPHQATRRLYEQLRAGPVTTEQRQRVVTVSRR